MQYGNTESNIFQFIINFCAIIGGVFTIAKMIDQFFYETSNVLFK